MRVKNISRGTFLVFRMPLLILLLLILLLSIGYGGWWFYFGYNSTDPTEKIRRGMRARIADLESYHARFKTIPVGQEQELAYCIEIWKRMPGCYRIEMSTERGGRQSNLQVVVGDRGQVYFYDHDSANFIPAVESVESEGEISGAFLENYWRSINEASFFDYIGEKKGARHCYYQVEIIPDIPHRFRVSERVWLEQDSFLPVRIESFDAAGCLSQVTMFELLQLNPALEAALFQIKAVPAE